MTEKEIQIIQKQAWENYKIEYDQMLIDLGKKKETRYQYHYY